MNALLAIAHTHAESVLPLRIFFSVCLVIVILAGLYLFKNRQRFFSRDPHVTADHYGARNLRLWQVILVWILAIDLLVTMLWRL
jgi:hypothetical protein